MTRRVFKKLTNRIKLLNWREVGLINYIENYAGRYIYGDIEIECIGDEYITFSHCVWGPVSEYGTTVTETFNRCDIKVIKVTGIKRRTAG